MVRAIGLGVGAYVAFLLLVVLLQRRMIYFPPRGYPMTPRALGLSYEEVHLVSEDGVKLCAWLVPAQEESAPVLLYLHGNAANLAGVAALAPGFGRAGFSFMALDYRGYGESEGTPSESGLYRDAHAAYRWIRGRGFGPERIFIYGQSIGAAVAAWLASREPAAGLVLEGAFPSTYAMARKHYPWLLAPEMLIKDKFRTEDHVKGASCPVLAIHGEEDLISPPSFGERVFAAAPEPKNILWVSDAGHNSVSPELPEVRAALVEFRRQASRR